MTVPCPLASPAHPALAALGPGNVLTAPPPDVQSLLDSECIPATLYFDAQRAQACARSQRDWPQLWRLTRMGE